MPVPMWVAQINKRVFNKREIKGGRRPVVTHVGRSSGTTYHTPLDAHPVADGFIFILMYGSESDWVQNILAAGEARLKIGDGYVDLDSPRLITKDEAWKQMHSTAKPPPEWLKVTEYLHMRTAQR